MQAATSLLESVMAHEQAPNSRVVLTGGPGVGKTAVIEAFRARGLRCCGDAARTIIRDRRRSGLSPRPEPATFALEILRREIAAWSAAPLDAGPVFFDRGVVDALAMAEHTGALETPEIAELLERHRYRSPVFLFPPWREIYVRDAERDHDFEHVERVHLAVRRYYERVGYRVVQVPRLPVEARADFVLERIEPG